MPHDPTVIRHVSETALWVAHYRALETERPDALFRDPYAKLLTGEKGKAIAESMGVASKYTQWNVIARTVVIDRYLEQAIAGGVELVINLGAGLDTRPYRMALPERLQWVEVDHVNIIDHKERLLASEKPRCRLERVRQDLADRGARQELFSQLGKRATQALILTEGVLPYLSPAQVSELAEDLHEQESFRLWIAEYIAKEVYRYLNHPSRVKRMQGAPFLFYPDDWMTFFRERGWVQKEIRYLGEESVRLNRKMPAPWWTFIFKPFLRGERLRAFQRMMGFVLFERTRPR